MDMWIKWTYQDLAHSGRYRYIDGILECYDYVDDTWTELFLWGDDPITKWLNKK
jgi:hypothetical protein